MYRVRVTVNAPDGSAAAVKSQVTVVHHRPHHRRAASDPRFVG